MTKTVSVRIETKDAVYLVTADERDGSGIVTKFGWHGGGDYRFVSSERCTRVAALVRLLTEALEPVKEVQSYAPGHWGWGRSGRTYRNDGRCGYL